MRLLKFVVLFISIVSIISCSNKPANNNPNETSNQIAKIENIEVEIEGMTCEIGCAKLIESKTYKLEGMTFANVSFEHKIGQFTFDSDKISVEEIEKHINGIAGGELYKVTSTTLVDEFTVLEENTEESE